MFLSPIASSGVVCFHESCRDSLFDSLLCSTTLPAFVVLYAATSPRGVNIGTYSFGIPVSVSFGAIPSVIIFSTALKGIIYPGSPLNTFAPALLSIVLSIPESYLLCRSYRSSSRPLALVSKFHRHKLPRIITFIYLMPNFRAKMASDTE